MTIGSGNLDDKELIDLASSENDAYKIDDLDKLDNFNIFSIVSSVSITSLQQSASLAQESPITSLIEINTYKYFTLPLEFMSTSNTTMQSKIYLEKFTIELEDIVGRSILYTSFDEKNPKSDDDYISSENPAQKGEGNYFKNVNFLITSKFKK